jgi:hypothetical protein
MKDSNINMNKPPLSETEINDAKDFDKILKGSGPDDPDPKPKASNNKFKLIIGGVIVALSVCALWFLPSKEELKNRKALKEKVDLSTLNVNPLLAGVDVPINSYTIIAENGGNFTTPEGTNIIVPANAFLDKNGKPVLGEVELRFREFHDVPSIFAAGINMTYDSLGTEYHFESAGMFEIEGFQNGEALFTNPDALIAVELASNQPGDYYNIYYQDPKNGWEYIRKDTAFKKKIPVVVVDSVMLDEKEVQLAELKKDLDKAEKKFKKSLKKEGILLPEKANNELYAMKIAFKNEEFPELAPYKNIVFEITEDNKDFDPKLAQQTWKSIELKKNLLGVYVMHLYGEKSKEKLTVRPVFPNKSMKEANKTFEELFEEYTAKSNGKLKEEREELKTLAQIYNATEQEIVDAYNASLNVNANMGKVWDQTEKVKRVFTIANFGMWNSDCPAKLPKGQEVYPVFVNEENEDDTLTFSTLYIAEYGKNALYTYSGFWGNRDLMDEKGKKSSVFENPLFTFNPKKETVVWFVTNQGNVAVMQPDDLKNITFSKDNTTIKMKVHKVVGDVQSIKKLLGWR